MGFETPVVVDVQDPISASASSAAGFDATGGIAGGAGAQGRGRAGAGGPPNPPKLRWVPPSLAQRTNAARLRSLSPASDMADVDGSGSDVPPLSASSAGTEYYSPLSASAGATGRRGSGNLKIAPAPLPPAAPPSDSDAMAAAAANVHARFDERNSYAEAGTYPYHPSQVSRAPLGFCV